jgi:UDP-N-acetyl-L-fucosamine synthase
MTKPLKILTVLGTRPEIIRLSRVIALLDQQVKHVLVHTGQNSDFEQNNEFVRDLAVRRPDHFLRVNRESLGTILADVLMKTEAVLDVERPDAVLVLGGTNSAYAAVIARQMNIPVYHMEAGNRSFDFDAPAKLNQRVIDHVSSFNLVSTEQGRRNLLAEGIPPSQIYLTGSPMREVLDENRAGIDRSNVLERLQLIRGEYFVVSMHRAEIVDVPRNLVQLSETLNRLCRNYQLPVVVSAYPRTRQRLVELDFNCDRNVRFLPPVGYHDYLRLQTDAFCTLSDSSTLGEEASILGFPAVTMRNEIEQPAAIDTAHMAVTDIDPETILRSVQLVTANRVQARHAAIAEEFEICNTSSRVVQLVLGMADLGRHWKVSKAA